MTDLRGQLPASSTKQYPTRALSSVRRVVVHHTATRSDITPQQVAQFQVTQGLAGIKYHFFINGDGTISWVQPVEAVVAQTNVEAVNADGVAVCLAGNFATVPPGDAQMEAAAQTIAWLLDGLGLTADAIIGRSEVDASDPSGSPGAQWLAGAVYKEPLVARVQAIIDEATPDQDAEIQRLQQRIRELEQQIADLQTQASQVPALTAEVQALRAEVARLEAQVQDLTTQNTQLRRENARLTELLQNNQGGGGVTQPPMVDLVDSLPKHPTLPAYQNRTSPRRARRRSSHRHPANLHRTPDRRLPRQRRAARRPRQSGQGAVARHRLPLRHPARRDDQPDPAPRNPFLPRWQRQQ